MFGDHAWEHGSDKDKGRSVGMEGGGGGGGNNAAFVFASVQLRRINIITYEAFAPSRHSDAVR